MFKTLHALSLGLFLVLGSVPAPAIESDPAPPQDPGLAEIVVHASRVDERLRLQDRDFDEARDRQLLPKLGASTYSLDQQALDALPQGKNTPVDKVLLQVPGVSYDSAVSNPDFHVRNEYANVQYRINGIQLPDGVSALGPVLETGFIGNLNLLDGVLPAQYGLRTAGVVDITSKQRFDTGGSFDVYGGSLGTLSPSIEAGGAFDQTQYFLTGRYLQSEEGLESATASSVPIHDRTAQEKFFGYGSTLLGDALRLTYIAGAFVGHFQIPNVAGETPLGDFGPANLESTSLNEHEADRFYFGLLALQSHEERLDTQLSVFTRYAAVDFVPDVPGDLAFNDVASAVTRKSLLSGLQFDAAERLGGSQVLRAGFAFSVEQTRVDDLATVLPLDGEGTPLPTPLTLNDYDSKRGWTAGVYVQDEWKLRPDLSVNLGLRFDQLEQFVAANQLSPRLAVEYRPGQATSLHAGVARYFTPPMQAQATPTNLGLFQNTTQQPAIALEDPVRPERATYFDVGVDQRLSETLSLGADVYYKRSTDTLDDGQFGQAVVLTQFNYAEGFSRGAELKLNYQHGGLRFYANLSDEVTKAKNVVTNQYLIGDPVELAFLARNYTYASDAQRVSASTGLSYQWQGMQASIDGIYGSGLRTGFANLAHTPDYTQWNAAVARRFYPWAPGKALTLRLSAVNLFDRSYVLRSGDGIGEFAPQYGPRRELFVELTQQF
jgi:outer membrane receptor protein involved in Fe transport